MSPIEVIALAAPLLPASACLLLGLSMLVAGPPSERAVARLVSLCFALSVLASLSVCGYFVTHGEGTILLELGAWFHSAGYAFEASLLIDRLSAPMMALTALLCGLIGRFSATYLVREPGQPRFYLLLSLFATGMFLLVMAGSLDLLIAGWELVGISSMLLIAFFHERSFPVRNALRTFVVYRTCDIGLLVGTVLMHHYGHTGRFLTAFGDTPWYAASANFTALGATLTGVCLLFAASGKSALFPVGSWLPRAMEGPTPSSAIFYGALSVHAGAYLMLRMTPMLAAAPLARALIVLVGLLTAAHGTLVARVQTDVKSQLAYATTTQVGIIFVEIGLGLPRLALVHLISHALVRTLQLLRAPNALADALLLRAAKGGEWVETAPRNGAPRAHRLYHLSLERFHLDALWDRAVVRPLLLASALVADAEARWLSLLTRGTGPSPSEESLPMSVRKEEQT